MTTLTEFFMDHAWAFDKGKVSESLDEGKPPWKMTQAEYIATHAKTAKRENTRPAIPFDQWVKAKGYHPPSEFEQATALAGMLFRQPNMTKAAKGKLKSGVAGLALVQKAKDEYDAEVKSGKIKMVTTHRDLDLGRGSDQALLRVQHKRAIRKAMAAGEGVPAKVLKDYPELKEDWHTLPDWARPCGFEEADDWLEYDPRDMDDSSLFAFNDHDDEATTNLTEGFDKPKYTDSPIKLKRPVTATGDVVTGDTILFREGVFAGSYRNAKYVGDRWVLATVMKDSYGASKQQHTFTLKVLKSMGTEPLKAGSTTRRKGRNVYRSGTWRETWSDEKARLIAADEKHARGDKARAARDYRRENPNESLAEVFIDEGVHDKHTLKAIFLAGAGGAGKGAVGKAMFSGTGLKFADSDAHLERLLKQKGIAPKDVGAHHDLFDQARETRDGQVRMWADRRLGVVLDTTAWNYGRIVPTYTKLKQLGYDCFMVFIDTSRETAHRRNEAREKAGGRQVPKTYVDDAWYGSQRYLPKYKTLFGRKNVFVIDNDKDVGPAAWQAIVSPKLRKIAQGILRKPLQNPIGKAWVARQSREVDKPGRSKTWGKDEPVLGASGLSSPVAPGSKSFTPLEPLPSHGPVHKGRKRKGDPPANVTGKPIPKPSKPLGGVKPSSEAGKKSGRWIESSVGDRIGPTP